MTITSRGALRLALLEVEATLDVGASDESVRRKIDALLIEIERWAELADARLVVADGKVPVS